jgi:hypothetical protein
MRQLRVHGNGKAAKSPKEWAFEWTTMYEICMKWIEMWDVPFPSLMSLIIRG